VRRRDTCASGANIERFRQLDKFGARGVDAAQENRNLKPDALRTALNRVQALAFRVESSLQTAPVGTSDPVRDRSRFNATGWGATISSKSFISLGLCVILDGDSERRDR
jgi:hypothetical protein